jgi:hypothetical protein
MPVDLTAPLSWKTATGQAATALEHLQIVRPHVCEHLSVLFLHFGDVAEGKEFLPDIAGRVKPAKQHLEEVEAFRTAGEPGTPYVGVGLSSTAGAMPQAVTMKNGEYFFMPSLDFLRTV